MLGTGALSAFNRSRCRPQPFGANGHCSEPAADLSFSFNRIHCWMYMTLMHSYCGVNDNPGRSTREFHGAWT
jgi:hypothetical protein